MNITFWCDVFYYGEKLFFIPNFPALFKALPNLRSLFEWCFG
ncbi:hypothetical protein [Nostoc sp.]